MEQRTLVKAVRDGVGLVRLKRVRVICPACRQPVEAVAREGRVRGYCAAAGRYVDFLVEDDYRARMSAGMKKLWQDPGYRAKISAIRKKRWQDAEYRAKMRAGLKKRWQDPEYRAKMGHYEEGVISGLPTVISSFLSSPSTARAQALVP